MHIDSRLLFGWSRDLALAYAGGLVIGAPLALAAVWATGTEVAATVALVLSMAGVFVALRRAAASTPVASHVRDAAVARTVQRRVA